MRRVRGLARGAQLEGLDIDTMSNYRPICDEWLLARPKVSYYGAYPNGFLERARALLGVGWWDPVLHVCSGKIWDYPGKRGVGPSDCAVDLDPDLCTDPALQARQWVADVRHILPTPYSMNAPGFEDVNLWPALLADPPYTITDAAHYAVGSAVLPAPAALVADMLKVVEPGGKVGILHYQFPRPPKDTILVAKISMSMGWGNTDRVFTVFERPVV